ncbi:MAG: peptidoglycan DD-metalloendopeptidase family protein [Patescibacteria group bacterium]
MPYWQNNGTTANFLRLPPITLRIKSIMVTGLLRLLEGIMFVGAALGTILNWILVRPLRLVARFLFRHVFVHLYRWYRAARNRLSIIFAPAKNKIIYPLMNKSTIHVVLAVVAIAVIFNNFVIRETRAEEFGDDMLLGAMTTDLQDVDIKESALTTVAMAPEYFRDTGVVTTLDGANQSRTNGNSGGNDVLLAGSGALINPNLSSTTIGNRPREAVTYYQVEGGDTVSTIAEKFNISTDTILWENKLGPRDFIKPGDTLTILPVSGVSHQIKSGETLAGIAKEFKADENEIIEFNKLVNASDIEKDQILIIPNGEIEPPKPTVVPQPSTGSRLASVNIPANSTAAGSPGKLTWPTSGHNISQYYKWGHAGLDITGSYSSPTYAADDGRVTAVGWGSGYGNRIIVDHGNGMTTLYAHHSKMFVQVGDYVSRGQTIGMVGCTGWCTGPHIHFEVRINGATVNPLSYL